MNYLCKMSYNPYDIVFKTETQLFTFQKYNISKVMKCVTQIWFHKCKCCRLDYTLELGKRASAKSLLLQFDTFIPWMGYLMPQSLDYQSTFSFGANTYKIYMKWSIVTLFTNCHQFQKRNSMTYADKTLSYLSRCLG